MKTKEIVVSNNGEGMDAALAQAEALAQELNLGPRDAMHMRLLVEEMMNLMRSIVGRPDGRFWIEVGNDEYQLHLKTVTMLDAGQRAQLLSSSTSGKNEAHRGLMGKIRAFFEPMPIDETPAYLMNTVVTTGSEGDIVWSMNDYRDQLNRSKDEAGDAQEEWDELEKSVVSHIADNIKVSIRGSDVELTIHKGLKR